MLFCQLLLNQRIYDAIEGVGSIRGHFTPIGSQIVPRDNNDMRIVHGFEFFYEGWHPSPFARSTYVRGSARKDNLKPDDRKEMLDANVLKKHAV